jgi:glutaredoxin
MTIKALGDGAAALTLGQSAAGMVAYERLFAVFLMLAMTTLLPVGQAEAACGTSVTVYAKEGCPFCEKTENFLNENGVEYTRLDVEDPDVLRELQQNYNTSYVPVVVVDGQHVIGNNIGWLRQVLCLR